MEQTLQSPSMPFICLVFHVRCADSLPLNRDEKRIFEGLRYQLNLPDQLLKAVTHLRSEECEIAQDALLPVPEMNGIATVCVLFEQAHCCGAPRLKPSPSFLPGLHLQRACTPHDRSSSSFPDSARPPMRRRRHWTALSSRGAASSVIPRTASVISGETCI